MHLIQMEIINSNRQPYLHQKQSLEGDCHASCKEKNKNKKSRRQKEDSRKTKNGSQKKNHR